MYFLKRKTAKGNKLMIYFKAEGDIATGGYDMQLLCRHAIREALLYEGFSKGAEISVTFCDGDTIRKLNKTYRKKDVPTDVLSFPIFDGGEENDVVGEDIIPLGDIVLNLERAGVQAAELGHSVEREVAFLCVHSTLHLLGYDHERSADEDEDMCRRQREIVERLHLDNEGDAFLEEDEND